MKRFKIFFILVLATYSQLYGQVTLSRQVVGCAGGSVNIASQTNISHTVGETIVDTKTTEAITLTQGFHQPGAVGMLAYEIEVTGTSCVNSTDGTASVVNLQGCSPPYTVAWSNGATGNTAYNLGAGIYSVSVTTNACEIVQEFEILAGETAHCNVLFLNAFSPNGDGVNDVWDIENIEDELYRDNQIEIFNRWGQLVWEGSNYDNATVVWKGETQNGDDLSDGTYFYLAKVGTQHFKGYIELTR